VALALAAALGPAPPRALAAEPPLLQAFSTGGLEARSAALILSGQEGGALATAVSAWVLPAPGPQVPVRFLVDMEGTSLLTRAASAEGEVEEVVTEVHAYALRPGGSLAAFANRAFLLDPAAPRGDGWNGVKYLGELELPPGEYTLRVLVLRRSEDRFALTAVPLTVAAVEEGGPLLLPPLFPEEAAGWTLVSALADGSFPGPVPGGPAVVAARPVAVAGQERRLIVAGRWPGGVPRAGDLAVRLQTPDGTPVRELELAEVHPGRRGRELEVLEARLPPLDVRAGEYRLEVALEGGAAVTVPLLVAGSASPRVAWAAATGTGAPSIPQLPAGGGAPSSLTARQRLQLQLDYLEALDAWGRGDGGQARRALADLERTRLGGGIRPDELYLEILEAARDVGSHSSDCLVPILRLHLDLYREATQRRDFLGASHARRLVSALLDNYLERARSREAADLAASMLVELAGRLLGLGNVLEAEQVLKRASELAPDHPGALLALAAVQETLGDSTMAVTHLRRLLVLAPDPGEAQLRLAVNLGRTGAAREARGILRQLVRDPAPPWVITLAYEELAQLLIQGGSLKDAAQTLEEAVERFPSAQRFRIQLAAVLDRAGEVRASREVVGRLDRLLAQGAGSEAESPRFRYGEGPAEAFEMAERASREGSNSRLRWLNEALASQTAPAGGR
jgi:tetratricopeptide (TPR) repeat protein